MQNFWTRRRAPKRQATPRRMAPVTPIGSLATVSPTPNVQQLDLLEAARLRYLLPPWPRKP